MPNPNDAVEVNCATTVWDGLVGVYDDVCNAFNDLLEAAARRREIIWKAICDAASYVWDGICSIARCIWGGVVWLYDKAILPVIMSGLNVLGYLVDKILFGMPVLRPFLHHGLMDSEVKEEWRNYVSKNAGCNIYERSHPVVDNALGLILSGGTGIGLLNILNHLATSVYYNVVRCSHILGNNGVFGQSRSVVRDLLLVTTARTNGFDEVLSVIPNPDKLPILIKKPISKNDDDAFIALSDSEDTDTDTNPETAIQPKQFEILIAEPAGNNTWRYYQTAKNDLGMPLLNLSFPEKNGYTILKSPTLTDEMYSEIAKTGQFGDQRNIVVRSIFGVLSLPIIAIPVLVTNAVDAICALIKNFMLSFMHNTLAFGNLLGKYSVFGKFKFQDTREWPAKFIFGLFSLPVVIPFAIGSNIMHMLGTAVYYAWQGSVWLFNNAVIPALATLVNISGYLFDKILYGAPGLRPYLEGGLMASDIHPAWRTFVATYGWNIYETMPAFIDNPLGVVLSGFTFIGLLNIVNHFVTSVYYNFVSLSHVLGKHGVFGQSRSTVCDLLLVTTDSNDDLEPILSGISNPDGLPILIKRLHQSDLSDAENSGEAIQEAIIWFARPDGTNSWKFYSSKESGIDRLQYSLPFPEANGQAILKSADLTDEQYFQIASSAPVFGDQRNMIVRGLFGFLAFPIIAIPLLLTNLVDLVCTAAYYAWHALVWTVKNIVVPVAATILNILGYIADKILYGAPALRPHLEGGLMASDVHPAWYEFVADHGWNIYATMPGFINNTLGVVLSAFTGIGFLNIANHFATSVYYNFRRFSHVLGEYGMFGQSRSVVKALRLVKCKNQENFVNQLLCVDSNPNGHVPGQLPVLIKTEKEVVNDGEITIETTYQIKKQINGEWMTHDLDAGTFVHLDFPEVNGTILESNQITDAMYDAIAPTGFFGDNRNIIVRIIFGILAIPIITIPLILTNAFDFTCTAIYYAWKGTVWLFNNAIVPTLATGLNILGYLVDKVLFGAPGLRPYLQGGLIASDVHPGWRHFVATYGWDIYAAMPAFIDNALGVILSAGTSIGLLNIVNHFVTSIYYNFTRLSHVLGNTGVFGQSRSAVCELVLAKHDNSEGNMFDPDSISNPDKLPILVKVENEDEISYRIHKPVFANNQWFWISYHVDADPFAHLNFPEVNGSILKPDQVTDAMYDAIAIGPNHCFGDQRNGILRGLFGGLSLPVIAIPLLLSNGIDLIGAYFKHYEKTILMPAGLIAGSILAVPFFLARKTIKGAWDCTFGTCFSDKPFSFMKALNGFADFATLGVFAGVKKIFKAFTGYSSRFNSAMNDAENAQGQQYLNLFNAHTKFKEAIDLATHGKFPGVNDGQGNFRPLMRLFYHFRHTVEEVLKKYHDAYLAYVEAVKADVNRVDDRDAYKMNNFFASKEFLAAKDKLEMRKGEEEIPRIVEKYLQPAV